jgi:capsular exopolysaccharide synthesis family protein
MGSLTPYNGDPIGPPQPAAWNERAVPARAPETEAVFSRVEYLRIIRQRKWIIALGAAVGLAAGMILASRQMPIYRAQAALEIQGINQDLLTTRQVDPQATGDTSSQAYFNTQVRILQSRPLLERVGTKLRSTEPDAQKAPNTTVDVAKSLTPIGLARSLRIRPAVDESRIVEISFDAPDGKFAAQVVNTLIATFIEQGLESRWDAAQATEKLLNRKIESVRTSLAAAQERLKQYAHASGIILGTETNSNDPVEQTVRSLQDELSRAQAERVTKQAIYEAIGRDELEALPVDSSPLTALQTKLTELRREFAELSSNLTPEHYKVKRVQAQLEEMQRVYDTQKRLARARLKQELTTAQRREAMLTELHGQQVDVLRNQASNLVEYSSLRHEVETTRQLYESLLQKVREYGIVTAMRVNNVRIVEPAIAPDKPLGSRPLLSGGIGMFFGALFAMAWATFKDRGAESIQRPGDLTTIGNLPELGVIPSAGTAWSRGLGRLRGSAGVELITSKGSDSIVAESFRATVASLVLPRRGGEAPRVLVVSSLSPGEGKTTVTSNLGIALAEIGYRVLLIDTDRRRPKLHRIFATTNESGWSDLLRDTHPVEEYDRATVARHTSVDNLRLITAGSSTGAQSHLLYSDRLKQLLNWLKADFDIILLDTAPVLAVSDVRVLAAATEGVILVVKAGTASWEGLASARQRLAEDGTAIQGVVLNDWNPRVNGYRSYEAQHGAYYSNA